MLEKSEPIQKKSIEQEKHEQAQKKMEGMAYEEAIPIFIEIAELNPTNYSAFYGLITCCLNVDSSYIFNNMKDISFKNLKKIYDEQQEFISIFNAFYEFLVYEQGAIFPTLHPINKAIKKLKWIVNIDLNETLPKDKLLMNQTLNRIWIAICCPIYAAEAVIAFERSSAFQQQFGWKELSDVAECYLSSGSMTLLSKSIELYQLAYKKNPQLPAAYHVLWARACQFLEDWDEVFRQLNIIAVKDMYHPDLRELLKFLFYINHDVLEKNFFPQLKANPRPHHAIFWHAYFLRKMDMAKQRFTTCKDGLAAFYKQTQEELNNVFNKYPSYIFHVFRAHILDLEGKPAVDEIAQAIDLMNVNFILTTTESDYFDIIFPIYADYIRRLCEKRADQNFNAKEAFYVAYGVAYEMKPEKKIKDIEIAKAHTIPNTAKEIPVVQKMLPLAKHILSLRLQREQAWHNKQVSPQQRAIRYNYYTDQITRLLDSNGIKGATNRKINTPFSLFETVALAMKANHQQLPPICPPEIVVRFNLENDKPYGFSEEEPELRYSL